ncbi:hypothetical protein WDZ92_52610, partial [Nostoc sp. NIES-2111]
AEGWVDASPAGNTAPVAAGAVVLRQHAPELATELMAQTARVEEAQARVDASWANPAEQGRWAQSAERERAVLLQLQEREALLALRAPMAGRVVIERPQDLPGRYLRRGDVVGYVNGQAMPLVKVVLPQLAADAVREGVVSVAVRLTQDGATVYPAQLVRQLPQASKDLPSAALGSAGGGRVMSDTRKLDGTQAIESLFEVEVAVPDVMPRLEQALG